MIRKPKHKPRIKEESKPKFRFKIKTDSRVKPTVLIQQDIYQDKVVKPILKKYNWSRKDIKYKRECDTKGKETHRG